MKCISSKPRVYPSTRKKVGYEAKHGFSLRLSKSPRMHYRMHSNASIFDISLPSRNPNQEDQDKLKATEKGIRISIYYSVFIIILKIICVLMPIGVFRAIAVEFVEFVLILLYCSAGLEVDDKTAAGINRAITSRRAFIITALIQLPFFIIPFIIRNSHYITVHDCIVYTLEDNVYVSAYSGLIQFTIAFLIIVILFVTNRNSLKKKRNRN
mgnify:CR=1 FL=1